MAEKDVSPMKQLQELLQDEGLRREIAQAPDEGQVTQMLNDFGRERGFHFDKSWLRDVLVDVKVARQPTITEEELMALSSTYMMSDTPPMLCHTESCGGRHAGCC